MNVQFKENRTILQFFFFKVEFEIQFYFRFYRLSEFKVGIIFTQFEQNKNISLDRTKTVHH